MKEDIIRMLDGIREQIEKEQYWNAIARVQFDLMPALIKAFDAVLKRKNG